MRAVGINSPKDNSRNVAAEGGIVAVYYGGTLIGALIAGSLADRAGRIKAVVFGSMWALLGAVLQASAQNIAWMCCARVIAGVGVGAIDCVIPVWSAEVSSHSARGAFLAIEFFMVRQLNLSTSLIKLTRTRTSVVSLWLTGLNISHTSTTTSPWRGVHLSLSKSSSSLLSASASTSFRNHLVGS